MANNVRSLSAGNILLLFLSLILTMYSCEKKGERKFPPVPVSVAAVEQRSVPLFVEGIGNVDVLKSATVRAQITGYLKKRPENEGIWVKEGDLLFVIDPAPFEAVARQAKAQLALNKDQYDQNMRDYKRYEDLVKREVVSQDEFEQKRLQMFASKDRTVGDQAALDKANEDLKHCFIKAPVSGLMGKIKPKVGDLVSANQDVITTINQISPLAVNLYIPERQLPLVQKYAANATLTMDAQIEGESGYSEKGEMIFLDNQVDKKTGMIWVQGSFPNKAQRLWPGRFVNVRLNLSEEKGVFIFPSQAVSEGPNGKYVWVVDEGNAANMRSIVVDRIFGVFTVVKSGLKAGEKVVIDGQIRLKPGAQVQIKPDVDSKNATVNATAAG